MEFSHKPVLYDECMEILDINPNGVYVDGTLGGGGHAFGICSKLQNGCFIGIDRDKEAIEAATSRLNQLPNRKMFIQSNYADIKKVLHNINVLGIDGALLDLGVSSYQLDNPERGFSYMNDSRLDMRMNIDDKLSAYEVVNEYSTNDLYQIIRDYGEEKWAKRIAEFIGLRRADKPIETTFELNEIIKAAIPAGARRGGPHPSKRTFQAIRIEVNEELTKLKSALKDFFDCLNQGGVLAVITFHSLEDRIVKELFADLSKGCVCPKQLPICVCGKIPEGKIINRKPITASESELDSNPRSRSAKLRGIRKL